MGKTVFIESETTKNSNISPSKSIIVAAVDAVPECSFVCSSDSLITFYDFLLLCKII